MTNSTLLKEVISKSGLKYSYIANVLGITYFSLNKKINNITEFTASEIDKLRQLLNIKSYSLLKDIFFNDKVDK